MDGSGTSPAETIITPMEDEDDVRVKVAALSAATHGLRVEMVSVLVGPVCRLINFHPR